MFGLDDVAIGALGAGVLNYMGTQSTNQQNLDIANQNNQWSAQQYATRYQTQVKDLEAAGLNPMLAYMQSPGQAPTAQAVTMQNPAASATSAYQGAISTSGGYQRDVGAGIHSRSSAELNAKQHELIDANVAEISAKIKNIPLEGKRLERAAEMLYQQANLMFQQQLSENQRWDVLKETVNQLRFENLITKADYDAMVKTGFIGRIAREVKPISDIGTDVLDSFKFWKGKTIKENGTTYDRRGNPSGGFSRERSER